MTSPPQYVQHMSGHGAIWEVDATTSICWRVRAHDAADLSYCYLPKSEYRLCDPPPETWRDVTADIQYSDPATSQVQCPAELLLNRTVIGQIFQGFRLRKVGLFDVSDQLRQALIVEQRQP